MPSIYIERFIMKKQNLLYIFAALALVAAVTVAVLNHFHVFDLPEVPTETTPVETTSIPETAKESESESENPPSETESGTKEAPTETDSETETEEVTYPVVDFEIPEWDHDLIPSLTYILPTEFDKGDYYNDEFQEDYENHYYQYTFYMALHVTRVTGTPYTAESVIEILENDMDYFMYVDTDVTDMKLDLDREMSEKFQAVVWDFSFHIIDLNEVPSMCMGKYFQVGDWDLILLYRVPDDMVERVTPFIEKSYDEIGITTVSKEEAEYYR